jgi:hypothetical protein
VGSLGSTQPPEDGVPIAPIPIPDHQSTDPTGAIQHSFDREFPSLSITDQDPADQDPIIIWDEESATEASAASPSPLSATAQAYLRSQGIVNPATWSAFRVDDITDADLTRLLTTRQRAHLTTNGLWLPTCDPRTPDHTTGLIRLSPAQHQHRFVTAPVGIACPPGTVSAPRIVLVDHPLLALRLHERGVAGIAIVEDPVALIPLTEWLAERDVVTITTAKRGDLPLPSGITPVGTGRILSSLDRAPIATLALLGLDRDALCAPTSPPPPMTTALLTELHAYAVGQLTILPRAKHCDVGAWTIPRWSNPGASDFCRMTSATPCRPINVVRWKAACMVAQWSFRRSIRLARWWSISRVCRAAMVGAARQASGRNRVD